MAAGLIGATQHLRRPKADRHLRDRACPCCVGECHSLQSWGPGTQWTTGRTPKSGKTGKNVENCPDRKWGQNGQKIPPKNGKLARCSNISEFTAIVSQFLIGANFPFFQSASHFGCSARYPMCTSPAFKVGCTPFWLKLLRTYFLGASDL